MTEKDYKEIAEYGNRPKPKKGLSEEAQCWIVVGLFSAFCVAWNIAHFY